MHPILFHLGPVPVGANGVILGLGFVLGLILLATLARRDGLPAGRLIGAAVLIALGVLVGARLGFVLTHWADYGPRPLAVLTWWDGGASAWGAVAGGLLAAVIGLARLPAARTADLFAPVLILGAYFGRLGSLARPHQSLIHKTYHDLFQTWGLWWPALRPGLTDWGLAVHPGQWVMGPAAAAQVHAALDGLSAHARLAAAEAARHLRPDGALPHLQTGSLVSTPIYLALGLLVLFTVTLWLLRWRSFYGQVFWAGVLGWAGLRFLMEPRPGDIRPGPDWFHPLTLTQVWSLALAGLAVMMLFILWRRGAPGRQATRGMGERRKGD